MDALECFGMVGIMAGQSNTQHDIKELNNTLKQIAAAQGIKIKTIEEVKKEEEYKEKVAKAKRMGVSVEEFEETEKKEEFHTFLRLIASFFFAFFTGAFVGDFILGSTTLAWTIGIIAFLVYIPISCLVEACRDSNILDIVVILFPFVLFLLAKIFNF